MNLIQTELGTRFYLVNGNTEIGTRGKHPQDTKTHKIALIVIIKRMAHFYMISYSSMVLITSISIEDYFDHFGNEFQFVKTVSLG